MDHISSKKIVYIEEFDKRDIEGNYKYTCQICKIDYSYRRRRWFNRHRNLECDHIVPKSLFEQRGYKFDTLENNVKATIEFFHNPSNLRTLCYHCHRRVTAGYLRAKHDLTKEN
jgi:5-methylcytosine-specific restriction endonuclease McrA